MTGLLSSTPYRVYTGPGPYRVYLTWYHPERNTHLPHSVDHRQVSEPHGPEEVEHLGDVCVGGHGVGTRVHVVRDVLRR